MTNEKNHYRKVFKSDHLGVADLEEFLEEGRDLVFTIKEVKQQYQAQVAGKKIDANIAYFKEDIKPLVLNATNSKVLKSFTNSSFVEDWGSLTIRLEIDATVKMKGDVVGGVRISKAPVKAKEILNDKHSKWSKACESVKAGNINLEGLRKHYEVTDEVFKSMSK